MTDPIDHLYLIEHQVWARLDADGCVTQGITALGVRLSGEIYMCRPKGVGVVLEQGKSMGVVELAKSIVSVKSPFSGEVMAVNPRLRDSPELVHRDPYGEGWLLRLRPTCQDADLQALLTGAAVAPAMRAHAALFRVDDWPSADTHGV
jgi:glycine cleavage system H protein